MKSPSKRPAPFPFFLLALGSGVFVLMGAIFAGAAVYGVVAKNPGLATEGVIMSLSFACFLQRPGRILWRDLKRGLSRRARGE